MPVETASESTSDRSRKQLQRTEHARLAFANAIRSGEDANATAARLGIALSTYYKWKKLLEEHGTAWIEGAQRVKSKSLPGATREETLGHIIRISLTHPTWGVRRISEFIERDSGTKFSTGFIHAALVERGLSTKESRLSALHRQFLAGAHLTREQLRAVETIDPHAGLPVSLSSRPGDALIQGMVFIPHTASLGPSFLHMIVDAYDQRAFAAFPTQTTDCLAADFLESVLDSNPALAKSVRIVITNNGHTFSNSYDGLLYRRRLLQRGLQHRRDGMTGLRMNPLLKDVWKALSNFLFKERHVDCVQHKNNLQALNELIQGFLNRRFGDG